MPIHSLKARMFRIKQANGLDLSTALTTSPRRFSHSPALCVFHEVSRAAGPSQQATRSDGLPMSWLAFCCVAAPVAHFVPVKVRRIDAP